MKELSALQSSLEERLTRQFYDWEIWGRGWQVWDAPVELEPPFYPFFGHFDHLQGNIQPSDDARKPTAFSSFLESFKGLIAKTEPPCNKVGLPETQEERLPYLFKETAPLVEIAVALPPEIKIAKPATDQFLLSLGHVSRPVAFEVVGTKKSIMVQIACSKIDRAQIRSQLQAYFPECLQTERSAFLQELWDETGFKSTVIVDYGLSNEFMRPLRRFERFDPDPLSGIIGSMTELREGEVTVFQTLFIPVLNAWPESILRAVTDNMGGSFFADDRTMVSLAGEKISCPLFAVAVRVAAQSPKMKQAWKLTRDIGKSLRQFADPRSNELIPLQSNGYDESDHSADLIYRRSRRCGMLLNSDELVSLAHLPSSSVRSAKLKREERKTKAAPLTAIGHQVLLGENYHAGKTVRLTMSPEQRSRHMYLLGASGTGKSTLLLNLILQDIRNGEGLCVLDPHGDLIDSILGGIPDERFDDVVLLDPSDEQYPVGFNILSARSELERNLLSSDLVSVFKRLSTSWGDQMTAVLGNAILAFLESDEGGTLSDLRKFLVEAEFRNRFLQTVTDDEVVYYWRKEFPLLSGKPQGPILTRLDTFLRPKIIRYMVSQKQNRLDFGEIMNGRKILLGKLSQGLIGEENSYLLGTLIVSKLNQTAMSRQEIKSSERKPFYLYVDEFHNFVTPSMAAILSGARKYNLGLILAHQELHQLSARDSEVASAVISNPYTRICFRLGDFDAKKLEDGFSFFNAKDLQNLGVGEAICRMERSEYDFNLKTLPLQPVEATEAERRREAVVASSRRRNAMRREEVEALLKPDLAVTVAPATSPLPEKKPPAKPKVNQTPTMEKPVTSAEPIALVPPTPSPGRGGQQHKYLQQLIKRWAEDRGYRVTVEKPILDGLGSVDVALEKDGRSIACEISVSTAPEHELLNIQKCLAAGFEHILSLSSEKDVLKRLSAVAVPTLTDNQRKQVRFLTPDQVFSFLESLELKRTPAAVHGSKELLTAKELEELLRIDVKTIYSYVQRGLIPYVRIQSNLRFVKSEVLAWLSQRQFQPKARSRDLVGK